jgi:cobalt-zinc-cadmium efflux system protein
MWSEIATPPSAPEEGGASGHGHLYDEFAFAIAASLTLLYIPAETAAAMASGSFALLADAGQKLFYLISLSMPWGASLLRHRAPSPRYTFGLGATSILAAIGHAVLLLVVAGAFATEAIRRFYLPVPIASSIVILVSGAGLLISIMTVFLLTSARSTGLKLSKVLFSMARDILVTGAVLISGIAIWYTGWLWFDPLVSLLVIFAFIIGLWSTLRESLGLALGAVPEGINSQMVSDYLLSQPGVVSVHDLHIWAITTTEAFLTCHFVMPSGHPGDSWLRAIARDLRNKFGIQHVTIQIELGDLEQEGSNDPD